MSEAAGPADFGRVDSDGTVYVRTADGERAVGRVPDASPEEALSFFVRRYEALELEVSLLERRINSGALGPDDAMSSVTKVRESLVDARAVGDLIGLVARLDALGPVIANQRAARRAERAKQSEQTKARKEHYVAEAEKLAAGNDWRGGVNQFAPVPAGRVEGASPAGSRDRRRAVAQVLQRANGVHPATQGALRPAVGAARGRAEDQGEAGRRSRGDRRHHRLGCRRRRLSGADDPLEGSRIGAARCRRGPVAAVPGRAGHVLRRPPGATGRAGHRVQGQPGGEGGPARGG